VSNDVLRATRLAAETSANDACIFAFPLATNDRTMFLQVIHVAQPT